MKQKYLDTSYLITYKNKQQTNKQTNKQQQTNKNNKHSDIAKYKIS